MTEFRRDPLVHRWIMTGFALTQNPEEAIAHFSPPAQTECPFCEGKEFLTPPESFSVRRSGSPNQPGWDVRVIPNRATDLGIRELLKRGQGGIYDLQNASGIHETIIETPQHLTRFAELPADQIVKVLRTLQQRNEEHKHNHLLKGILIFKNQGKAGSGFFQHTASQIISLPFVPKAIFDELEGARRFYEMKNRCIFCDMIRDEKNFEQRVVLESNDFFAWCPFASRFPFEVWVAPKIHQAEFLYADSNRFHDLAQLLKSVHGQIDKVLGNAACTSVIHTGPMRFDSLEEASAAQDSYHWHIEILPQAWPVGGFEWGGDLFFSPLFPEDCAKILRQTGIASI